ncbi:hypothetical protein VP01_867g3 [Puccinia sorghi]|uniref:ER membrane protein complex subunit 6 n=1 Tax=Puccinia sorghi TaxID=27349 RepID=A0A0L6U8Q9_9BASI|nr:hypothetical protein VP01_867g3 [Puccinia sorghi]
MSPPISGPLKFSSAGKTGSTGHYVSRSSRKMYREGGVKLAVCGDRFQCYHTRTSRLNQHENDGQHFVTYQDRGTAEKMSTQRMSHRVHQISHPEFTENVIWNDRALDSIRSTCSCLSGAFAGIIGMTNFAGLGFYLGSFTMINLTILLVNYLRIFLGSSSSLQPNKNLSTFRNLSQNLKFSSAFWLSGLIDNCFGFVLFYD